MFNRFFKPTVVATSLSDAIDFEDAMDTLLFLCNRLKNASDNKQKLLKYLQNFPKEELSYNTSQVDKLRIEKQWQCWLDKIPREELEQVKKFGAIYINLNNILNELNKLLLGVDDNNLTIEITNLIVLRIEELLRVINSLPEKLYLTPGNKSQPINLESKTTATLGIKTLVVDHVELISMAQEFQFVANCCAVFLSKEKKPLPKTANLREELLGFKLFPHHFATVLQKSHHSHDEEKSTAKKRYKIPKKLHSIWIGSKLSPAYYQNLVAKCKRAHHHEINLWTFDDDVLRKAGIGTRRKPKAENLAETGLFHDVAIPRQGRIKIRNIGRELYPKIDEIFPENIASIIKQIIDLESEGFKNLATVSDLLRFIILLAEGGWYSDTDESPQLRLEIGKDLLKRVLTKEEFQQFILASDPDFRTPESFASIMGIIRQKLYLHKLPYLKQALQKDQVDEIEKNYGKDIWQHAHDEKYENDVDDIWFSYVDRSQNKEPCLKSSLTSDWNYVRNEMQKDISFKQPSDEVGFYHNKGANSLMGGTSGHPSLYRAIANFLLKYIRMDYQKPQLIADSLDFARKEKLSIVGLTQVTNLDLKRLNKEVVKPGHRNEGLLHNAYTRRGLSIGLGPDIVEETTDTIKDEEKRKIAKNLNIGGIETKCDMTWLKTPPTSQDTLDCPRFRF